MPKVVQQAIESTTLSDKTMTAMLGNELKSSLVALKLQAELHDDQQSIVQAEYALRAIDNVLLFQKLQSDQEQLDLEPVHVGSALTEVLEEMDRYLSAVGCETEIYVQHGITTVDADRAALISALECMLQAVVAATKRPSPIKWHVFKSKDGVRISLTNNSIDLNTISLPKLDEQLQSTQPVQGVAGPATNLVTAHGLMNALGGTLRKVHRQKGLEQGFGVTLRASEQLSLV